MAPAKPQNMREKHKMIPPLDAAGLDAAALRYVERFQTTRARLVRLLRDKLRTRGWQGDAPPDPEAVAERMAALGYIDDAAFADARARGMARRGMGSGRVRQSLAAYGVQAEDAAPALAAVDAFSAALELARRKRLGPWGPPANDPKLRQRQLAAMARGGHDIRLAKAILAAPDIATAEALRDAYS